MVERVPRKRGVIHLDIDLEILIEAVMAQETDHRLGIVIVLVLGRLHRFRLDQEGSFETVFTGVIARHREHHRQMVLLAFHVGIEQRHIPLAAAPKDIILAAERDRCVDCVLDLRAGISHCRKIGIGRSAVHITCITENVRSTPKQLHAGLLLFLFGILDDRLQVFLIAGHIARLAHEIDIVEAIIQGTDFYEKVERRIHLGFGLLDRIADTAPREKVRRTAERIAPVGTERMPVGNRKAQLFLHGFASDYAVCIIPVKRQRIFRIRAFVLDFGDL